MDAGLLVLVGLTALLSAWRGSRAFARAWRNRTTAQPVAARLLGLTLTARAKMTNDVRLEGAIDGYQVRVEGLGLPNRLRVVIGGGGKIPRRVAWGRRSYRREVGRIAARIRERNLAMFLAALPRPPYRVPPLIDCFGRKERAKLASALRRPGIEVRDGEVVRDIPASSSGRGLARQVHNTVLLADIVARGMVEACERALAGSDPDARLEAARIMEEKGIGTLRALAMAEGAPARVVAEAIRSLESEDDRPSVIAALLHAIEAGNRDIGSVAIEVFRKVPAELPGNGLADALMRGAKRAEGEFLTDIARTLGELKHQPAVGVLGSLLRQPDVAAAAEAAHALGDIGGPRAQSELVAALEAKDEGVLAAVVDVLGAVGDVDAIEPLREAARTRALSRPLAQAVRRAISLIQQRSVAVAGQLSLADAERARGALSVSAGQAAADGALSLPASSADGDATSSRTGRPAQKAGA